MSFHGLTTSISAAQDGADQYKTELMLLINFAAQCKAYQLPQLNQPPSWYPQAQQTWAETTGTLSGWAMSTLATLVAQPTYLINSGAQVVQPSLIEAISDAQGLVANPGSNALKSDLMATLSALGNRFTQMNATTNVLITSLSNQAGVFDQNAQTMNGLVQQALQQQGIDQAQITALQADIKQLHDDINAQIAVIVGGSVATIAGVVMGGVAIGLAAATGGISLFLMVPALIITAGGIYAITMASLKIEQDKAQIAKDQGNITDITADVTMLASMQNTLSGFAGQVDNLKNALQVVIAPWQAAATYFANTLAEMQAIENATSQDWQTVADELTTIQSQWGTLMATMQTLKTDADVSAAQPQFGMDDTQVQALIQSADKVDLITYLSS